jgi:hypothetical protein
MVIRTILCRVPREYFLLRIEDKRMVARVSARAGGELTNTVINIIERLDKNSSYRGFARKDCILLTFVVNQAPESVNRTDCYGENLSTKQSHEAKIADR